MSLFRDVLDICQELRAKRTAVHTLVHSAVRVDRKAVLCESLLQPGVGGFVESNTWRSESLKRRIADFTEAFDLFWSRFTLSHRVKELLVLFALPALRPPHRCPVETHDRLPPSMVQSANRMSSATHHVYLSPGMFGFTRLGSYDYFTHVQRALGARFKKAGQVLETHLSDVLPTASVRRRAARLAELIASTCSGSGPIHLLGHSTGGLDARLVASPSAQLPTSADADPARWLPRLASVTTMNTPHYGTPLASFFATAKGQQALYALSAFTVIGLSLGERPLAVASVLMGVIGRSDRALGITLPILDRSVESLLGVVDDARNPDVRTYLKAIKDDQGAMLQLSPEAMDLMVAGFEDRPGVWYQSTVSMAPTPSPRTWVGIIGHPWHAISLALFTALHDITARYDEHYPCARVAIHPDAPDAPILQSTEAVLAAALGRAPDFHGNDGCVPIRSQLWGTLVWAGLGDHLDVLGHYHDITPESQIELRHHDWLTSGSHFDDASFDALMDAVANGMLKSAP